MGVGPICVAEHLVPFLPGHKLFGNAANQVSGAPFGSAGILPITYGYIRMMGTEGLTRATKIAILSANYLQLPQRIRTALFTAVLPASWDTK